MPIVKFTNENIEIEVGPGENLRTAAIQAGINLYAKGEGLIATAKKNLNCHGLGMCGTCRVLVTKGMENTNSMGAMETFRFHCPLPDPLPCMAYINNEDNMRLACCTTFNGDIEVETTPPLNLFGENFFS